jgi:signal transduction histidine kinase
MEVQAGERDAEKERLILELADTRRMLASTEERARQAETVAAILHQTEPGQPTRAMTQVTQTEVGPVVESACEKILPLLRQRNLTLDIAIADDLPLVGVRESILRKLALSLLENACRASLEENSVLVRAEVDSTNANGHAGRRAVALRFTDSGVGIAPDDQGRVFSSPTAADDERPVAGLGGGAGSLGLVRKLAQTSGGDLDFESTAGRGTTFTLHLPAADVQPWTLLKIKQPAAPDQPVHKSAPAKE